MTNKQCSGRIKHAGPTAASCGHSRVRVRAQTAPIEIRYFPLLASFFSLITQYDSKFPNIYLEVVCSLCKACPPCELPLNFTSARDAPVFDRYDPITLSFSIWCSAILRGDAKTEKTTPKPRTNAIPTAAWVAKPLLMTGRRKGQSFAGQQK